ncbi:hypothetical protein EWM64_g110 [Hericium alpestre]|uniref:Uncharacterized protein n=1 Tax=Hericium alpestre TaxID=135208 RepID=A0A4Z0ACM6_9AGAM|nr:hypothetical protein EWM64_g110 [Hericium alpestre]
MFIFPFDLKDLVRTRSFSTTDAAVIFGIDPSFVSLTDNPQDLTLPLIVYGWRHEESDMEKCCNIQALSAYLEALRILPSFADDSPASSRTPFDSNAGDCDVRPDDADRILGRLFKGLGTMSFEDMRRFIDELCQCKISPQHERHIFMHLAYLFTSAENEGIADSENFRNLQRAVVLTEMFWRMHFESIRQAGSGSKDGKELLLMSFVTLLRDVRPNYKLESDEDTQALVFAWVKAGIFELLELVAIMIVPAAGKMASIHALSTFSDVFEALNRVLRANPSAAFSVIRSHLPRPRLLRSLLDCDLDRQEGSPTHSAGELIMLPDCDGRDPKDYDHSLHMLWLTVFLLQSKRNLRSECARRECDKAGRSLCGACRRPSILIMTPFLIYQGLEGTQTRLRIARVHGRGVRRSGSQTWLD